MKFTKRKVKMRQRNTWLKFLSLIECIGIFSHHKVKQFRLNIAKNSINGLLLLATQKGGKKLAKKRKKQAV